MKTIIIAASLVATVLASSLTASAAPRGEAFDGAKFFESVNKGW